MRVEVCLAALMLAASAVAADPSPDELFREAQERSWSKDFDGAIALYDRLLAIDPGNAGAALERAKVLSWAKRHDEAEASFRKILESSPSSRDARLGLARSLSWGGKQEAARVEYERVLAANPKDAEALLGVAQTYAWSGDTRHARPAYEAALAADPSSEDAKRGLEELQAAERRARAPWLEVGYDHIDDSDDVKLDAFRVEGGLGLPANLDLRLGIGRWKTDDPTADGSWDSFWAVLGWEPAEGHRLEGRAGADKMDGPGADTTTVGTGGLSWSFPIRGTWGGRVAWEHVPYRYSPEILENRVVLDTFTAWVHGTFKERWRVDATPSYWDVSDGNARTSLDATLRYLGKAGELRWEAGYAFRWRDWDQDLDHGYFDPSSFHANAALGALEGRFWRVDAEAGVQSFTEGTARVSGDFYGTLRGSLFSQIRPWVRLEGYAGGGSYAAQGGDDWTYRELGAKARFTFGAE